MKLRVDSCPRCLTKTLAYDYAYPTKGGVAMFFRCPACGRGWFTSYVLDAPRSGTSSRLLRTTAKRLTPEVQAATSDYRAQQDRLGAFLTDRCELGPHFTVAVKDLFEAYAGWAEENGEEPLGKTKFGDLLKQRGITQRKAAKGTRRWMGIREVAKGGDISG